MANKWKLTKDEKQRRDELIEDLRTAASVIEDAVTAYNEKLSAAQEFIEEVASRIESDKDDMSDKWQEGDKGEAVQGWIDSLREGDFDDLEFDTPEHADSLENMPEDPDSV